MLEKKNYGITKIVVKGFKSIAEECEIDICPLTILAGANSSGKSSIMQPLLLLKQTLEAPYDDWPMDFDDVSLHIQSRYLDAVDRIRYREHNKYWHG